MFFNLKLGHFFGTPSIYIYIYICRSWFILFSCILFRSPCTFSFSIYIFRENAPLWADLDGDEDQESLVQSKSQRRSPSEVDMSRKEKYALK